LGEFDDCPLEFASRSDYFKFLPQIGYIFNKEFFCDIWVDLTVLNQGHQDYFIRYNNFKVSKIKITYDETPNEDTETPTDQYVKYLIYLVPVKN
jgi:hypothetical protein